MTAEVVASNSLGMLSWNIKAGGFSTYDPSLAEPERQEPIRAFVRHMHSQGVDSLSLIDAYRWDELYQGDIGIAAHLGYQAARFIRLDDERLNRDNGRGIGIAFATDRPIEASWALDLDTRQALGIILETGKYGLQIANVYLDDLSEDVRLRQVRALLAGLKPDMPTLLVGDFNALRPRPDARNGRMAVSASNLAIRSLALMLPEKNGLGQAISEMDRRQAVPLIETFGFQDADKTSQRPTAPARLPLFGIDYVWHNQQITISDFRVLPIRTESDHRPIAFLATVP